MVYTLGGLGTILRAAKGIVRTAREKVYRYTNEEITREETAEREREGQNCTCQCIVEGSVANEEEENKINSFFF